ncbi:LLM class flavin-dependent oxidoreductase [Agrobacterium rubi]|uniref:Putative monooxygenase n=1 Tax=Agrobacterium rubi TR3 = NBRC 13261 TaxID=1368415 RepID=A0A081D1I3_9HYPH|nr:LLM class flavin-dependent oxidoreductase [Agrobacterium rubi]MBP1881272.1 FMN-dependent oxidoreductase (nitrilotriacetate monooxygenase family) [Agrobacterium rubi]MCL6652167.1 monooxygenase [Agrobacterium rubi]NTF09198.1 LLM class flavin-dependent oxidoreductase [Agrobacterium rubi]NTF22107.1 LLM class flavin-dependent oxidoreductase [Agrobacterium rubi]NTF28964.1 LLM class flavin-dependent oxidoreductase [Agrobacterium rubi]
MTKKQIRFGIMLQGPGGHMNAWRHPKSPVDASVNFQFFKDNALKAEAAGISFAFVADGLYINDKSIPHFLNRFEPLTILSALAAVTTKIGLAGTVSTSYSDPFTVARQFASLDLISGGRAGWNAVTTPLEGTAKNYSRNHPEHALRYEIADEYLEVIKGLWDSWDDDAFTRNRETGQFFDKAKLHTLGHKGRFFSVEGPLNIQRSAQGQPVIFQAGSSEAGIGLAGKHADAVFTNSASLEENHTFLKRVKQSAVAQGRSASDVKIFPGIGPIVAATQDEAEQKYDIIRNLITIDDALAYLGRFFDHHDFSVYDLDAPFPELGDIGKNSFRSTTDRIKQRAKDKNQTLREAALEAATPREGFIGTPEKVADEIIRWVENDAADGFILGFSVIAEGLDDFIRLVIPVLQQRGYFDPQLEGSTLRDHLGLPFRQSVYSGESTNLDKAIA